MFVGRVKSVRSQFYFFDFMCFGFFMGCVWFHNPYITCITNSIVIIISIQFFPMTVTEKKTWRNVHFLAKFSKVLPLADWQCLFFSYEHEISFSVLKFLKQFCYTYYISFYFYWYIQLKIYGVHGWLCCIFCIYHLLLLFTW